jgi:periplasmic divalent cation tolerance protein
MSALKAADDIALLYVTFPNQEDAARISRAAVEQKLAACANVFAAHQSIYLWNDQIEAASETAVLLKTTHEKSEALNAFIQLQHSYELPCVAVFSPEKLNSDFEEWIKKAVAGPTPSQP